MPQDTIFTDNNGSFIVVPNKDSISPEAKQYIQQFIQEQQTENKKDAHAEWIPLFYTIGILVVIWIIIRIRDGKSKSYVAFGSLVNNEADYDILEGNDVSQNEEPDYLVYEGSELGLDDTALITILNKRSQYFTRLSETDKEKFIYRLHEFMKRKTFFIHDKSGFKEMPVLISTAAIQLSFGLTKYLLPDFPCIHIFPEEFVAAEPTIRFLEGNVSDNCINISWKHFLNGFNNPSDGQNVGLHEMAHAYYFQNVETPDHKDNNFVHSFSRFNNCGNNAFEKEHQTGNNLYSEYAMRNFQEFWAESVEIFFEKPTQLKNTYPDLYSAMSNLLNQDPMND